MLMPKTETSSADLPDFLTVDPRVPSSMRDLLDEADGCGKVGFLTGGTACAQRVIQALLTIEKIEGPDTQARLKALGEKYPAVPQMLSSVLTQFGDATSREGAKLNANALNLLVVTLKALVYEIYVLGLARAERLEYVKQVFDSLERKAPDKRPNAPTGPMPAPAPAAAVRAS